MNGIGDISNSKIEKIEQQVQYNTVLSEEIREAILLITALIKEDLEWKRQERAAIVRVRLAEEKRNYAFKLFDKWFRTLLVPLVVFWLYLAWLVFSPLFSILQQQGVGFSSIMSWLNHITKYLDLNDGKYLSILFFTVIYAVAAALIAMLIARKRSQRRYMAEIKRLEGEF